MVAGSPLLLHNICSKSEETYSPKNAFISLHPSPFGSRKPVVPTARTVTVARVASPISTNRTYQPLFLHSLKVYFNSTKRLVKKGDIIAVSLDTDATRLFHEGNNSDETKDSDDVDRIKDRFVDISNTPIRTNSRLGSLHPHCAPMNWLSSV